MSFIKTFLRSKTGIGVQLLFMLIVPLIFLVIPSTAFDNGPPLCLFTILADVKCIGCGLTRGVMHFIHFDFSRAWAFNPLSFVAVPVICYFWMRYAYRLWKSWTNSESHSDTVYSQSSNS
jgi:hypothetical protein